MRREIANLYPVIGSAAKQSIATSCAEGWIASRSLSSGAHSRDPLARNDDLEAAVIESVGRDDLTKS
jgi:hypothetical protein